MAKKLRKGATAPFNNEGYAGDNLVPHVNGVISRPLGYEFAQPLRVGEAVDDLDAVNKKYARGLKSLYIETFTNSGPYEIGTTQNDIMLRWQYNQSIASQNIDGTTVAVDVRHLNVGTLSSNRTYVLSGLDIDGKITTAPTTVQFKEASYGGSTDTPITNQEEIKRLFGKMFIDEDNKEGIFDIGYGLNVVFAVPKQYEILSVYDIDGLNVNLLNLFSITAYAIKGCDNVTRFYNLYSMPMGLRYSTKHKYRVTIK